MSFGSPYNFVPLSPYIIFPNWAKQVSQDVPFSDGLDGEIDFEVKAVRDIFIRNSGTGNNKTDDFFHTKDKDGKREYYIPGTSLKGMLRSVLEIASYGKMQHIDDKRYAIRDLQLPAYTDKFTQNQRYRVQAGWLDISDEQNWTITPCNFALWERRQIDRNFGNSKMSGHQKYEEYKNKFGRKIHCNANITENVSIRNDAGNVVLYRNHATLDPQGNQEGYVVFTGQPQDIRAGETKGKYHEFFFYGPEGEPFKVDEESVTDSYGNEHFPNREDFEFINHEQKNAGDDDDYTFWVKKGGVPEFNGQIPVFYIKDGARVRFGFSLLFRFAGELSVGECARNTNKKHYPKIDDEFCPDLADLIFGYATSTDALRGRVQVSSCKAIGDVTPCPTTQTFVLGTPKPTFYPAYLEQTNNLNNKTKYKTFLDKNAKLRGWKRYTAIGEQDLIPPPLRPDGTQNENIGVKMTPLPKGTVFSGKIRYHNLRPIELGALLWAMRLKNEKYYCHTIGMAKPYGYGRVKISIKEVTGCTNEDMEENIKRYIGLFTNYVFSQVKALTQEKGENFSSKNKNFYDFSEIKELMNMMSFSEEKRPKLSYSYNFNYLGEPRNYADVKKYCEVLSVFPEISWESDPRIIVPSPKPINTSPKEKEKQEFFDSLTSKMSIKDCIKKLEKLSPPFTEAQKQKCKTTYKSQKNYQYYKEMLEVLDQQ